MKHLRTLIYNEIEKLENQLQSFETNQYGVSSDYRVIEINNKIDKLEIELSETWSK
jgi:hypothetical protein